ncbi:MAG: DUF397 domain-containing protein [Trebonia sp.]
MESITIDTLPRFTYSLQLGSLQVGGRDGCCGAGRDQSSGSGVPRRSCQGGGLVPATDERSLAWRKSGTCTDGECLEVACYEDSVMVRDSARPSAALCFTLASWRYFTVGIASWTGDRDRLGIGQGCTLGSHDERHETGYPQ